MGHECRLYLYRLKTNSGKKLLSGKHGSQVSPFPLIEKKMFSGKHGSQVLPLRLPKKTLFSGKHGSGVSPLPLPEKKLFSRNHGSRVSPLPLPTRNEQCKRLFPQKHVCKVKMDCETHQNPC